MTDIYDIKALLISQPINIVYSLVIIVLAMLIYFLVFKNYKTIKSNNNFEIDFKRGKNLRELLINLEKNIQIFSKDIFYKKLDYILRYLIKRKYKKDINNLTYKELENLDLDSSLKDFIKNIYFKEYSQDSDDNLEIRKNYINHIRKII